MEVLEFILISILGVPIAILICSLIGAIITSIAKFWEWIPESKGKESVGCILLIIFFVLGIIVTICYSDIVNDRPIEYFEDFQQFPH